MMTLPRFLRVVSPSLFIVLGFACAAVGQTETATVSGLVTDRTGAAVAGAEVRLQSVERGTVTTTTTNNAGIYVFPSVQAGQHQISIQKQGFKQVDLLGLIVNVQDHVEQNFRLEVGSVAESVTVEAGASMINTTDASVSTVVDQTYVKNMPLNGRSLQDLILLTAGVVTNSPQVGAALGTFGEFSVNGQRTEANNYTVDGVSGNLGATDAARMIGGMGSSGSLPGSTALGTTQALVSVDDLQEFRVQSSTYSAEYGRNPGGQFVFETKSGTNQLHGTAFDYLRNGALDAPDWFNNYFGLKAPAMRQNDFGGTLGGLVRIPRLYNGKDRTFFFVSYEGLRLAAPQAANATFVPDAALRSGAPPALRQVLNAFPAQSPNGIDDAVNGIAQFIGSWSTPATVNSTTIRFDHTINDKLRLFFRFSNTNSKSESLGVSRQSLTPATDQVAPFIMRTYTAGASSAFSSRVSNEIRFNFSSNEVTTKQVSHAIGGNTPLNLLQSAGFGPEGQVALRLIYGGYFIILQEFGQSSELRQWNLVDTASLSFGRHQVKFGVDYRRLASTLIQPSPEAFYDYLSKAQIQANSLTVKFGAFLPAYPVYTNLSAFAQDEWRVSQRLSLSLGLRWEVNPAPGATGLKPYAINFVSPDPATWTLASQGTPLWQTTWFNFAPRLGAAYILRKAPGHETVVRGGGGVFFDTGQQKGSQAFAGPGFFSGLRPVSPASFPAPVVTPPIVNPPVAPLGTVFGYPTHLQLPYTLQWNASVQQALGNSQALTISYVGAHGVRLLQEKQLSVPSNPNTHTFLLFGNALTSDYDSLQVQFFRRLSRGLTALASYTWSHCLDYGSRNFDLGYQRGNCDFDVRHNLSAAFSYDLPNAGHNGFLNAVLHHWGLDERFTARTAFPVTLDGRTLLQPDGQQYRAGLNLVPGQAIYLYGANCAAVLQGLGKLKPGQGCPGGRAINPQAFSNVSSGFGNAPRNFARGFGAWQVDTAIRRDFPIHERLNLQFRAEAFNIFNHPNFGIINSSFGSSTFGQATATLASSLGALNPLYQMGGPRSMQFALKLIF